MQPDTQITAADLTQAAREALEASGLTQAQAAERFGKSQPTIAQAVGAPGKQLTRLRIDIIEAFTDFEVVGPHYTLRRKAK